MMEFHSPIKKYLSQLITTVLLTLCIRKEYKVFQLEPLTVAPSAGHIRMCMVN